MVIVQSGTDSKMYNTPFSKSPKANAALFRNWAGVAAGKPMIITAQSLITQVVNTYSTTYGPLTAR